ncbi:histidine kinase dimerization/phosphoacceptor domain -containing protein [Gracilinema caldarium]|uniref:histidine kinase n=1 Tax=Gracilinema caldarium (strain ATCC 51460 / DSM 7334 / H1) TaxID=744872 RepID=F8F061_GRAC1|nr:transporter substrate-binding domain-containing protein [Gracilinema caldarium]AEJ18714.1 signal transduction histidine kinase [Gracilinema caldarium DSM 7334]
MRNIRFLAVWGLLFIVVPLFPQDDIKKEKPILQIRVVCDDNYPPYVFRDETGAIQGIIPEQWQAWSSVTGIKVQFDAMDWANAQEEMKAGRADVIDSMFRTPERERIYDFLAPYADVSVSVYFNKSISGIAKIQDLKGFRIAVKEGDAAIEVLKEKGLQDFLYFPSYETIIRSAKNHEMRVFCIDEPPAEYFLYKYGLDQDFRKAFSLYSGRFHRAVLKERKPLPDGRDLYKVLLDGFSAIPPSVFTEINDRWMGQPISRTINWVPFLIVLAIALGVVVILSLFILALRLEVARRTAELIQKNRALLASERKNRAFISALPDLFLIFDREGRYIEIKTSNPGILIKQESALLGSTISDVGLPESIVSAMKAAIARALDTKDVVVIEYELEVIEGRRFFEARIVRLAADTDLVLFIVRDITQEHLIKKQLAQSLREKETLLKEIHHRVKNNLQVVSSLIQLQASALSNEQDQALLEETQQRIRTMAQVHELLYRSESLSSIEMKTYFEHLLDELSTAFYEIRLHVAISMDLDPMEVSLDIATPLGLIFNEAVTNAFKYAYADRDKGQLRISLKRLRDGQRQFIIADDGPGLPENWQERAQKSLGFTLIETLVQQIKGCLDVQNGPGTTLKITF